VRQLHLIQTGTKMAAKEALETREQVQSVYSVSASAGKRYVQPCEYKKAGGCFTSDQQIYTVARMNRFSDG